MENLARFGYAVSDQTRTQVLLLLAEAPAYPADLADTLEVSRQKMSNHLTCLRTGPRHTRRPAFPV